MTAVYAISLAIGLALFAWWIVAEARRSASGSPGHIRRSISGLVAFGMGGLSASFSGLHAGIAAALALGAAAGMIVYSERVSADADR